MPGRGQGNGPGRGKNSGGGYGTGGNCICAKCGTTVPHQRGNPCTNLRCPKCGTPLVREQLLNGRREQQ